MRALVVFSRSLLFVFLGLAIVAAPGAARADRLAVLEFEGDGSLETSGLKYLSDEVRGAALNVLRRGSWEVITRDNMLVMLESNRDNLVACEGECEVETGRLLGADLVVAGVQLRLGSQLRVQLKAYDTRTGNLLAMERAEAETVDELLAVLGARAEALYVRAIPGATRGLSSPSTGQDQVIDGGTSDWSLTLAQQHVVGFDTEPPGATVSVDGNYTCVTPCSKALGDGGHTVAYVLARYDPLEQVVDVSAPMNLQAALVPQFGWLTVHSTPSGLPVLLNGNAVGPTPLQRIEVAPGEHEVLLGSTQWLPDGRRVHVRKAEEKRVDIMARMRIGGLRVGAVDTAGNDLAVSVSLNGQEVGITPWVGEVQCGTHSVTIGSWQSEVEIQEAAVEELVAEITSSGATTGTASADRLAMDADSTVARSDPRSVAPVVPQIVDWVMNADPVEVVLQRDLASTLVFSAQGRSVSNRRERETLRAGLDLLMNTNIGTLSDLRAGSPGQYLVDYSPPVDREAPAFAVLSVTDVRFPDTSTAFFVLPLVANVDWEVRTGQGGLDAAIVVAGKRYGPVATDADGLARVGILVPPGVTTAQLDVSFPNGARRASEIIDLNVPSFSQIKLCAPADRLSGGATPHVHMYVISKDGTPATGATIQLSAELGTLGAVTQLGNGLYQAMYYAPLVSRPHTERITASLAGVSASSDTVEFQLVPAN